MCLKVHPCFCLLVGGVTDVQQFPVLGKYPFSGPISRGRYTSLTLLCANPFNAKAYAYNCANGAGPAAQSSSVRGARVIL